LIRSRGAQSSQGTPGKWNSRSCQQVRLGCWAGVLLFLVHQNGLIKHQTNPGWHFSVRLDQLSPPYPTSPRVPPTIDPLITTKLCSFKPRCKQDYLKYTCDTLFLRIHCIATNASPPNYEVHVGNGAKSMDPED